MSRRVFNLETVHDTAQRTMTQTIDPFTVLVDWKNMTVKVLKEDKVVELICFDEINFSLSDYEKLLIKIEESANRLRAFKND